MGILLMLNPDVQQHSTPVSGLVKNRDYGNLRVMWSRSGEVEYETQHPWICCCCPLELRPGIMITSLSKLDTGRDKANMRFP